MMSLASDLPKVELRSRLRKIRSAILPAQRQAAAWAVTRSKPVLQRLRPGKSIALYVPVGSEFPSWPLIFTALQRGCKVYLPRTPRFGRQLEFVRLNSQSQWQIGPYNIPVPSHPEVCSPRKLDTVFVPLLGFDSQLARLGQGGGYYDATFAFRRLRRQWRKPKLIGLAFSSQRLAQLPLEPWDLRLDAVQTENSYCRAARY
ncbi:5-formyltetrahydrofolate cyclo-ligase [Chitinibacter sp. GC72]|uniref:5-formyltetrahydrofolate cyclo-ligase n=1 Tax=Chitinibacter sp. GC72 TaxID=1526917 RepID=UPI0027E54896|nr:5-formyltetrahydrofolate cyclo-ligase [Chitinibacter sp. GC72]